MPYVGQNYKIRCDEIAANGYEGFRLQASPQLAAAAE
jgi:hypothetical protein